MTTPVCVITNAYPDYEGSYHGIFVRRTVEDMAERGWLSHVLAPRIFKQSEPFQEYPTHTVTRFLFPSAQKLSRFFVFRPWWQAAFFQPHA